MLSWQFCRGKLTVPEDYRPSVRIGLNIVKLPRSGWNLTKKSPTRTQLYTLVLTMEQAYNKAYNTFVHTQSHVSLPSIQVVHFMLWETKRTMTSVASKMTLQGLNPLMVLSFKTFQNLLTGKMAINMSEPFKTLHNFLLLHYHTFQYPLKGRKIGLWYVCSESCFTFQNLS